jgi:hypothetical protein
MMRHCCFAEYQHAPNSGLVKRQAELKAQGYGLGAVIFDCYDTEVCISA